MDTITNLNKDEAVEFLRKVINENMLSGDISGIKEPLESAIRIAIAHLSNNDTNKMATAIDGIFQMYKRNNSIDKSYRNAARFILSVVNNVPVRYEGYETDATTPEERMSEGNQK